MMVPTGAEKIKNNNSLKFIVKISEMNCKKAL
jgi:hypothetical protein